MFSSIGFADAAVAAKLTLDEISTYFNQLITARAPFTQVNDDGTLSTVTIYIRRPGRIRFEYNPPDDILVLAEKGKVAIFDNKSNQPPERFPLSKTPLFLILAKDVNLNAAKMVVAHNWDGTATTVTAQDPKRPEYGNIQLVFTGEPVALRQWIVTDGSGQRTTLILGELVLGERLGLAPFDIKAEMADRGF